MNKLLTYSIVLFVGLALIPSVLAQSDRGTLTGTISDPTGALVPTAEIVAVNPATGVQLKTAATNTGSFTIASVPAGVTI